MIECERDDVIVFALFVSLYFVVEGVRDDSVEVPRLPESAIDLERETCDPDTVFDVWLEVNAV